MGNQRLVFAIGGFYLLGLGVLTGMLIEEIRFDESRSVLLTQLEEETHGLHERLIPIEHETAVERKGTQ